MSVRGPRHDDGELHLAGPAWQQTIHENIDCRRILKALEDGEPRTIVELHRELGQQPARSTVERHVRNKLVPAKLVEVVCREPLAVKSAQPAQLPTPKGCGQAGIGGRP